ncbi:terminase small subunit [Viridibacillus arvi]|uniref:terminase small subunit n=1 Tax=Viridibacillus arvi TaxID=263475 RepID=UPI00382EBE81
MARPRDPRRDEAKQVWLDNDGEIKLVDLAEQFEVTSSTMRKWKATDKWDDELKGSAPKQSNKSAPIKKQSKTAVKKEPVESELVVSDDNELTDKQRLFVGYYVKYWNATKAYKKVNECTYNTARTEGSRLLANPCIKEEIIKARDGILDESLLSFKTVLQKYMDIAFADIGDFVERSDGGFSVSVKPLEEMDTSVISELSNTENGIKLKLADKMKALDMLAKYTDLLDEKELKKLRVAKASIEVDKLQNGDGSTTQESEVAKMLRSLAGDSD